jgi:hypothetical protein
MTHPGGRPTDYTRELGEEICHAIATSSKGLIALCKLNPHWPDRSNIFKWRRNNLEFRDLYEQAKKDQVEALVDECLDIADDTSRDSLTRINAEGEEYEVANTEYMNRSRLRIDTRKFLAAKLAPKLYGEKVNVSGDIGIHETDRKVRNADEQYK